ncbi:uncharacterized protein LTR77_008368 [Saxophila tyrrhenica]|uniref:Uncharacterized protein n=1 Tax=Saxophila tyrrhenica TaxID=1690608 RepID=A0AAV9P3N5_9PEZI|nr:hypothetical protein LTR77_008368 [Saxophila tyrrhenica]
MRQSTIFTSLLAAASSAVAQSSSGAAPSRIALSSSASSFAASSSSAAPQTSGNASIPSGGYGTQSVTVLLENAAMGDEAMISFQRVENRISGRPSGSAGPFTTVEISVGQDANQALRCQVLDDAGMPIAATRGPNFDNFDPPAFVNHVVCDPAFVGKGFDLTVTLQNADTKVGRQTFFPNFIGRTTLPPTGGSGPFKTVAVFVGQNADPAIRCQLNDASGNAIVATRGTNVDTTFSDAQKGAWTFQQPDAEVAEIICDPALVAAPQ